MLWVGAYTAAYLALKHGVSPWLTLPIGMLLGWGLTHLVVELLKYAFPV